MGRPSITLVSLIDAELTRQAAWADSHADDPTSVAAPAIQLPAKSVGANARPELEKSVGGSLQYAVEDEARAAAHGPELTILELVRRWASALTTLIPLGLPQLSSQGDSSEVSVDLRGPIARRVQLDERGRRSTAFGQLARGYDTATATFNAFRAKAVDLLGLTPGEVVLDVGCGTGLCFSYVQQRIGPTGRIIGVDRSVEMLAQAEDRCTRHDWWNVTLIESDVESADIRSSADAALFCAAHDILQSPAAIRNVLRHVRTGGRCVAVGGKWAPPWLAGFNVLTALMHGPYVRSFVGFDKPWTVLMQHVPQLQVTELALGTGYAAVGQIHR